MSVISQGKKDEIGGTKVVLMTARYMMAIMGSIGLAIVTGFKANVSVAIVAMVNHTAIGSNVTSENFEESASICKTNEVYNTNVTTATNDGPFVWDESLQGLILSAYFWGYLLTQIPGGRASELFSARWMLNGSVFIHAIASILSPVAAEYHYSLFIFLRFAQGLGGGASYPALHVLIAKWSPPAERHVLSSIVYAGFALGTVVFMSLSGLLAEHCGWASIFYVEGVASLFWCVAWWFLVQDSPEQQTRFITQDEKDYIARSLGQTKSEDTERKLPVPWRRVLRSKPFWAIVVAHFCCDFGIYMLMTELPTYMSQILKFNHNQSAALSAMPFFAMWIFGMLLGKVLAIVVSKGWITMTVSRKIAEFIASIVPMCCLIAVSYVGCDTDLAIVFMTIGVTCIGASISGFLSNHIDIAPNFAGTLMAVTNTIATIPGFVVPMIVGSWTYGNHTIEAWRKIFFMTAGMYALDFFAYVIFGTTELQPWNDVKQQSIIT